MCCPSRDKLSAKRKVSKGFSFVRAKLPFGALIRGLQNLDVLCKGTDCHFLHRAKSNQKARGTPSCDLDSKLYRRKILAKISDGTSRNQRFAQDDGEKALNRCEVRVLQREDLERRLKEQPCSLVDSRLWLGANLRC